MADRTVRISITGDASDLSRALRGINGPASSATSVMGKLGSVMKTGMLAAAAAVAVAGVAVVKLGIDAVQAAAVSAKMNAQTEAVIKSMGIGAQVTAEHVANLSEALSLVAGVDDEVIQGGTNLLLTFGNVIPILDRASEITLDLAAGMAAATGTELDMKGAAIQVGKALNDPIKGLTALSRVGVSFSEGQKEQITNFVEQGKLMQAQEIIMSELENQFKGSAKANADAMDKVSVAIGQVKEDIGTALLPTVEAVADAFGKWAQSAEMKAGIKDFSNYVKRMSPGIIKAVSEFFGVETIAIPKDVRHRAVQVAREHGKKAGKAVLDGYRDSVRKNKTSGLEGIMKDIKTFIKTMKMVWGVVGPIFKAVAWGFKMWGTVLGTVAAELWLGTEEIIQFFKNMYTQIKGSLSLVVATVSRWPSNIMSALSGLGGLLVSVGADLVRGLISGIQSAAGSVADAAVKVVTDAVGAAKGALGIHSPSKVMMKLGQETMAGFALGISSMDKPVRDSFKRTKEGAEAYGEAMKTYWQGVADKLKGTLAQVQGVMRDYKSSIRDGFSFDVTGIQMAGGGRPTAGGIRSYARSQVALYKRFAHALQRVARMGASPGVLQDLVAAGPEGGLAIAQVLAQSPRLLRQVSRAERSIDRFGGHTADVAGNQVSITFQGNVYGFADFEKAVMKAMAKAMKKKKGV